MRAERIESLLESLQTLKNDTRNGSVISADSYTDMDFVKIEVAPEDVQVDGGMGMFARMRRTLFGGD